MTVISDGWSPMDSTGVLKSDLRRIYRVCSEDSKVCAIPLLNQPQLSPKIDP